MGMTEILLINPNTSERTTDMMVTIARVTLPAGFTVRGVTARNGPPMILTPDALAAAGDEVLALWQRYGEGVAGVVVSAFGDPGLTALKGLANVPVTGICEASVLAAAQGGRRFGIATVTPDLVGPIEACVHGLGIGRAYTGTRLTREDPEALTADPARLEAALGQAVEACVALDGAQAVVIGGGPLGQAAIALSQRMSVPVIAPIPAAMRRLLAAIGVHQTMYKD